MNHSPQVLLYNLKHDIRTQKLRQYLNTIGAEFRTITAAEYLHPLGFLFGLPGFEKNPQFNLSGNFSEEMMILYNFSSEQLDSLLAFFRENKLPSVALKAVLTPINQHWSSLALYQELVKEREAMKK